MQRVRRTPAEGDGPPGVGRFHSKPCRPFPRRILTLMFSTPSLRNRQRRGRSIGGSLKNEAEVKYSVVIPVFNSEGIVADTIRRTVAYFTSANLKYELVLVNDGSTDGSWSIIKEAAEAQPHIIAINLLRNSGQHNANLCGFRHATGDWLITMDDDLQNPPEEIGLLIEKASAGYDLVLGRFQEKRHALYRKLGSYLIRVINRKIFGQEKDLVLSNFRLIHRDVVDRVCNYRGPFPYIPGLCLLYSGRRANVLVEHHPRRVGVSNYSFSRILVLVSTILFNYSSYPLRFVASLGIVMALGSLMLGGFYLSYGLLYGTSVPGWTTLVVMISFFNGMVMLMLAMLGEYLVRIIGQITMADPYFVDAVVRRGA